MDIGRILQAAESASPVDAVAEVASALGQVFGAVAVSFLITDASGRGLVRLAHVPAGGGSAETPGGPATSRRRHGEESAAELPFDGGPEEQALRTQAVQALPSSTEGQWRVLAPVTERGESLGLLEMYLPAEPDQELVAEVGQVAHLLAFVIIANRRHTDLFEWGQRSQAYSLSAEIQQRLLPGARTCEAAAFTIAGWLEPAAAIGGDTFDYSLARDLLHLSLTDAMGHGVGAALTASMCLGSLRGTRRRGVSLLEQARSTNEVLFEHPITPTGDEFVAGLMGRLELRTSVLEIVNAGHVPPLLLRDAELTSLDLPVNLPLGMFAHSDYVSAHLSLEPGDRLVFVTDGMLERSAAGLDLPAAVHDTSDLHPREVVRALADSALRAAGHTLQDDATVMCVDWHGHHEGSRVTVAGAETSRASEPLE